MRPPKVHELQAGKFSLLFNAGDGGEADEVVEAAGHEPNGYFWQGVMQLLVAQQAPELEGRFDYDPEAGMFCAYGSDRAALDRACALLTDIMSKPAALRSLIEEASPDAFDD